VVLVLVALLAGQMLLMSLHARNPGTGRSVFRSWTMTAAGPFLSTVGGFVTNVTDLWRNYADLRHTRRENEALRQDVARLQLEIHQLQESARMSDRLQRVIDFQRSLSTESVMARVIGRDVSGWFQSILVDRGRQHGIQLNSPVLTPEGLVGRVTAVGPYGAQVRLITDERSGAGAVIGILGQSRAIGVVEGKNEALCRMRYVPGSESVVAGEIIYTTGQDGIYPKGIPIGRVLSVEKGSTTVSHDITVEPLAKLSKLEEVVVLLGRPDNVQLDSSVVTND